MSELADVIIARAREGVLVVELHGEYDLTNADETERLFARLIEENELIVVDLTPTEFIDSSFLRALLRADRTATEAGKALRLQVGEKQIVRQALEISQVLQRIEHVQTREEALE